MDQDKLEIYKKDLKRFVEIKKSTQLVLAEKIDFSKYKDQIMKLLDKYVTAKDVEVLSKEISLSDMHEFNQYIEDEKNGLSDKSKADAILAQTKKVLSERYELQDEVFYGKFSELIRKLLEDLKTAKKEDLAALLGQAKEIQKKVAEYFNISVKEMQSSRRARTVARPRQVAMYLAKQLTSRSLPEIGRKFDRDHTTVMHAVRKVEELILEDSSLAENVDSLRRALEA